MRHEWFPVTLSFVPTHSSDLIYVRFNLRTRQADHDCVVRKFLTIKSPDEWAITKQACSDESIVSVFFPIATNITLYFYVSSTIKRKNQYTDFQIYMCETDYKLFIISCMKVIHSNFAISTFAYIILSVFSFFLSFFLSFMVKDYGWRSFWILLD